MSLAFDIVTLDSPEPIRAAAFWSSALDLVELEREDIDRWILLGDTDGTRRLGIQRGVHRPGGVHLDLRCEPNEFGATVDRLIGLGAAALGPPRSERYGLIANLRDPDGNCFDVCAYTNV